MARSNPLHVSLICCRDFTSSPLSLEADDMPLSFLTLLHHKDGTKATLTVWFTSWECLSMKDCLNRRVTAGFTSRLAKSLSRSILEAYFSNNGFNSGHCNLLFPIPQVKRIGFHQGTSILEAYFSNNGFNFRHCNTLFPIPQVKRVGFNQGTMAFQTPANHAERKVVVIKFKRSKRPCLYYSNSSATFHCPLEGDLVFKLNPGPTRNNNNCRASLSLSTRSKTSSAAVCPQCEKTVRRNQKRLLCEVCKDSTHVRCTVFADACKFIRVSEPRTWTCSKCSLSELPFHGCRNLLDMSESSGQPSRSVNS